MDEQFSNKRFPERYILDKTGSYRENPEYVRRRLQSDYGFHEEDLNQAIQVCHIELLSPKILSHQAYLALLSERYISEDNEFELSSKFDDIWEKLMLYEKAKAGHTGIHTPDGIQAAKEILELLSDKEGNSEIFPYDLAEKMAQEFEIDNPFD